MANKKKKEAQREEQKRLERQAYLDKINRIKSNETVQQWAKEIYYYISATISQSSYLDHEFHLRPYKQDFVFGMNLQAIYLEHTRKVINQTGRRSIFAHNFAEEGLPELKNKAEMITFTEAVAELIEEKLKNDNIKVEIKKIKVFITQHGYTISDFDDEMIKIVYKHPTSNAQW